MLPPYVSEEIRSTGETRIFHLLRTDPESDGWIAIHSLGLARHVKRVYGEIDFVVVAPGYGVFCLEVKSGRVGREDGIWSFTDRFGQTTRKSLGPFLQAREGMFSLLEAVRRHFGIHHKLANLVYRYGVMFPDIRFDIEEPEHEAWEVYDIEDRRLPLSHFIKRLASNAHRQLASSRWYIPSESRPSPEDARLLADFLRGDFERIPSPAVALKEAEEKLLILTSEQYECLDQMSDNRRCLFEGSAGTGKTVLAMEFARREAALHKRVLLLCYNRLLGTHLERSLGKGTSSHNLTAESFHSFLYKLVMRSKHADEFRTALKDTSDNIYRSTYPLYSLVALQEAVEQPFDVLIVDEGQDLINEDYLDVLDALLIGGLSGGRWAFFCDFQRQAIYADLTAEEMHSQMASRTISFARYRLTVNCRNTKPIGEETSLLSGFDAPPFLKTKLEGVPVDYRFFGSIEEEARLLEDVINRLLAQGISPGSVTILSPVSRERSCVMSLSQTARFSVVDLAEPSARQRSGDVDFSTIQAFKGLENSIVILTDIADLVSERGRSLLYVGMSRARQRLFVLLSRSARKDYDALLERAARKIL
jgi:hypothetical protein